MPGMSSFIPSFFGRILQPGGKMLETCTRLHFSMPASLRASSYERSSSLCVPTPLVKNTFVGTNLPNCDACCPFPFIMLYLFFLRHCRRCWLRRYWSSLGVYSSWLFWDNNVHPACDKLSCIISIITNFCLIAFFNIC